MESGQGRKRWIIGVSIAVVLLAAAVVVLFSVPVIHCPECRDVRTPPPPKGPDEPFRGKSICFDCFGQEEYTFWEWISRDRVAKEERQEVRARRHYWILPKACSDYLHSSRSFDALGEECEFGNVLLAHREELKAFSISLEGAEGRTREVLGLDLIAATERHPAHGALVYLVNERMFGTLDADGADLIVFPEATWEDIVKEPTRFLNARWAREASGGVSLRTYEESDER